VLGLLVAGSNSGEIARALTVSPNTVRTHVQSILAKLQVHSRLEAVAFARRNHLLSHPSATTYERFGT
jgi:DNA-binding NarL/FixJ family response regulator